MNSYQNSCGSFANGETEDYSLMITSTSENPEKPSQSIQHLNWSLHPNPAGDHIQIRIQQSKHAEFVPFTIYDVRGNMVLTDQLNNKEGHQHIPVDISHLSSGLYFLRIEIDGKTEVKKFQKSH